LSILDKWWPRRLRSADLSAFADGELTGSTADRVAERLVFDAHERESLSRLRQVDKLLVTALPAQVEEDLNAVASADTSADAILAQLPRSVETHSPEPPVPIPAQVLREGWPRNWTPTVVASVGLLVTAGVAFAGLKRRGWV